MSKKIYKSVNGEKLYLFNFIGGGFNDVWAKTKAEAIKKAKSLYSIPVNPASFRTCTFEQYQEQNRLGWMMSM